MPLTRRSFLQSGFLGLGTLTLPNLLRLQAESEERRDTAVILLFVHGGPSHLETYDLKPDAPEEIRGPFRPTRTAVPGVDVCEHLPLHAKTAKRFTLIRSCSHDEADHFRGHARFLSGYGAQKTGTAESYYPMVGAVAARLLEGRKKGLPASISLGHVVLNGPDYAPGIAQGYWPASYRPPIAHNGLPGSGLLIDGGRFTDRRSLLKSFDVMRRELDSSGTAQTMDAFHRQAIDILTSTHVRDAFDVSREEPRLRDRYGDGYGRQVLLARRMVEAGVGFVAVGIPGSAQGTPAYDWDDHAVNWDMLTAMKARLPRYDRVITTLIDDLHERGLEKKVLLIVTGEFGRTPRLEHKDGRIGRDHWPSAMSILISGGGFPMGQVFGATNKFGEHPSERKLDPHDILATIYRHLGIDHRREFPDPQGRPIALARGTPLQELF